MEATSELICKETVPAKTKLLNYIEWYSKKLKFKMLDYTDYQKFRDETFKLNETTFDLELALNEIVELFEQEANQKLLNLQTTLSPTIPNQICSDRQRIQQMMFSFISTAIESTQYGTINISVAFNTESEQL